jgi:hypothetical protein
MKKKLALFIVVGVTLIIQLVSSQTWQPTKRLTYNSGQSYYPAIATDSNNHIHVVWDDTSPGNQEIFYKKSTNGGTSWTTRRLTWNSGESSYPRIAVDLSNNIHMFWLDDIPGNWEIYHKKSTDGGSSWITSRLTYSSGRSYGPDIAIDSNSHIHAVWADDTPGNLEIYYKKSTDGGISWSTKRITWIPGSSGGPAVAVDSNNNILLVWTDKIPGTTTYKIYYKRSTDGGATWPKYQQISWIKKGSRSSDIAVDSNDHIHVVWSGDTGNPVPELYYQRSSDGGATWTKKRLTWILNWSQKPIIAIDSNDNIHVAWRIGHYYDLYICYKRSTDGGATWPKYKRLTWSGLSGGHEMGIGSNKNIHMVWSDEAHAIEIYYKKGIQ